MREIDREGEIARERERESTYLSMISDLYLALNGRVPLNKRNITTPTVQTSTALV